MIKRQFDSALTQLVHARDRLGVLLAIMGLLLLVLLLVTVLLASKKESIVVLPDVVTEPFTLSAKKASASYLRQMADYYTRLIYSTTPQSVDAQIETLLFHVPPHAAVKLKSQLIAYADTIKQKHIMSTFYPTQFLVDEEKRLVEVTGDFRLLLGDEQIHQQKTFRLHFLYDNHRLWIKNIEELAL